MISRNPLTGKHLLQRGLHQGPLPHLHAGSQSPYGEASLATGGGRRWSLSERKSQSPYGEASLATGWPRSWDPSPRTGVAIPLRGSISCNSAPLPGPPSCRGRVAIPLRGSISCNSWGASAPLTGGYLIRRNPLTGKHLLQQIVKALSSRPDLPVAIPLRGSISCNRRVPSRSAGPC